MKKHALLLAITMLFSSVAVKADEGMWLPLFIKRLNEADMQKKGLKLTAEEIYSVNGSSLKDAIVSLGGFCTGEMISPEGLMLTNHHCAFSSIQSHSTTEHDYLQDGFWAMNKGEELPVEGLTASFVVRMEDVTEQVLGAVTDEAKRDEEMTAKAKELEEAAMKDTHYKASVRSFFDGNQFFLFVYEIFRDVRLVGAPPSSIGKYGGDTDNWMWPRHTGDFSLFRVYAGDDNKPADYSPNNKPFKPRHFLPVSINGVEKADFSMVMGYPGSTDRFLTSYGVQLAVEKDQPTRVKVRGKKLEIIKNEMNQSHEVKINYASRYAQISNYWKYFIGQTKQVKRNKVLEKKQAEEAAFNAWVAEDAKRKERYGNVLKDISDATSALSNTTIKQVYTMEGIFDINVLILSYRFSNLHGALKADAPAEKVSKLTTGLKNTVKGSFEGYHQPVDRNMLIELLGMYYDNVAKEQHPEILTTTHAKYKGDWKAYVTKMEQKTMFFSEEKLNAFLDKPSAKTLEKDPVYQLMMGFLMDYRSSIRAKNQEAELKLEEATRIYVEGILEMKGGGKLYPNANSTLRLTYGQVLDYKPADAVHYNYFTTLEGVMAKEDPSNEEFIVPAKLKELFEKKDYGQYGTDGKMIVNFITNNDITGGNSGSPVINGNGELIGCAFDGNWEAMSGDIAFENTLQRTIVVDARFILFVIDKYAGAKHLIEEMTVVKGKNEATSNKEAMKEELNVN